MALYITIISILGAPLASVLLVSTRSTAENDVFNRVKERNRTTLYRIESEVRRAIEGTVVTGDGGKSVTFTPAIGHDGTALIPGQPIRFSLVAEAGESANGVDDNGNGLVDEGRIERTEGIGGAVTIAGDVDVARSGFAVNGLGLTVTVATQGSLRGGNSYAVMRDVTVYPRN